jgi:hypothetical protein
MLPGVTEEPEAVRMDLFDFSYGHAVAHHLRLIVFVELKQVYRKSRH